MSDFFSGFTYGLSRSLVGLATFGLRSRYINPTMYNIANSSTYLSTCYADLDSPSGLSSLLDGGMAINNSYNGGFTGLALGGVVPLVDFNSCEFGGYSFGLGGYSSCFGGRFYC